MACSCNAQGTGRFAISLVQSAVRTDTRKEMLSIQVSWVCMQILLQLFTDLIH